MKPVGRFAPTPSGRMHMGNLFAALLAWLSVRSRGGIMVLRMEDLDPQRTKPQYADQLRRDLQWLGLDWDVETPPQSQRMDAYEAAFRRLSAMELVYPCYCSRARLHSLDAPHSSDGVYVYDGRCKALSPRQREAMDKAPAWRLIVPEKEIGFADGLQGVYREELTRDCGDFVLRRADGAFVYQLAVVVDDATAGVTEVVRGRDLLSCTPRQMYLQSLLELPTPQYYHVPLLLSGNGRRLSKRDGDMDLGALAQTLTAEQIIGRLAFWAGILPEEAPVTPAELIPLFDWKRIQMDDITVK